MSLYVPLWFLGLLLLRLPSSVSASRHESSQSTLQSTTITRTTTTTTTTFPHNRTHSSSSLHFVALGDWGGREWYPYTTRAQVETAHTLSHLPDLDFILALGDNFYSHGVPDASSFRFAATFDNVYNQPYQQQHYNQTLPSWYVIGGNHDHYGNISAQLEYAIHHPQWIFPDTFYQQSFVLHNNNDNPKDNMTTLSLDIIFIDTVILCGLSNTTNNDDTKFDPLPLQSKAVAFVWWEWLEDRLAQSTADYLLVAGHYPIFSVCQHGPTETLVQHLRPLLQHYQAHYVSGHDHCMVHQQEEIVWPSPPPSKDTPQPHPQSFDNTTTTIHYILSGMGDECCYKASNQNHSAYQNNPHVKIKWFVSVENQDLYQATSGFTEFQATREQLEIHYRKQDGAVLYRPDPILPRNKKILHQNQQQQER